MRAGRAFARVAPVPVDLLSQIGEIRRDGVDGLVEADVVVGVDLAFGPVGGIEAFPGEGKELGLLGALEDRQGTLARGTVISHMATSRYAISRTSLVLGEWAEDVRDGLGGGGSSW